MYPSSFKNLCKYASHLHLTCASFTSTLPSSSLMHFIWSKSQPSSLSPWGACTTSYPRFCLLAQHTCVWKLSIFANGIANFTSFFIALYLTMFVHLSFSSSLHQLSIRSLLWFHLPCTFHSIQSTRWPQKMPSVTLITSLVAVLSHMLFASPLLPQTPVAINFSFIF